MKKFFSVFFILILLGVNLQIASAATETPTFRYNLTWNIRSIYYYTDSSAQSKYGTPISALEHNNTNPYSIMAQSYVRAVYTVQKVDNDAFNLKHP
ncbi:hypothetical protein ACQYAD_04615 [Neobacillus sp. SM06]|uniref:hypothetical protein n=1 Tax=Neobacillus sp. SM06 TaxID=3422492 RepID=UPI003D2E99F5